MQNRLVNNCSSYGNTCNSGVNEDVDTDTDYDTTQEDSFHHKKQLNNDHTTVSTVRSISSLVVSLVSLMTIVVVYCCIGGVLFHTLEGPAEVIHTFNINQLRNDTVLKLWNITDQFNVLYKENWTSLVSNEIIIFQKEIIKAVRDGFDDALFNLPSHQQHSSSNAPPSSLMSSLLTVTSSNSQLNQLHSSTVLTSAVPSITTATGSPVAALLTTNVSPQSTHKDLSINDKFNNNQRSQSQWTFAGSFLYSLSLITTTGNVNLLGINFVFFLRL